MVTNYIKGRAKEYRICNKLKAQGYHIVQRTAGSHSPIDIIAIDTDKLIIKLIQAKPKNISQTKISELLKANSKLNNEYLVYFEVL